MAITYAGGIIYVPDGSEVTPIRYSDILAADVAGGWGVFSNPYPGMYASLAKIYINGGWLYQYNENLSFVDNALIASGSNGIYIYSNGGFTVGQKIAEGTGYAAVNGGSLLWLTNANKTLNITCAAGTLKLYDAAIRCCGTTNYTFITNLSTGAIVDILGSKFNRFNIAASITSCAAEDTLLTAQIGLTTVIQNRSNSATFKNCVVNGQAFGVYTLAAGSIMRDTVISANYCMWNSYHGVGYGVNNTYQYGSVPIVNVYDDTIHVDRYYWSPTVGHYAGGVFVPDANVALSLDDGKGNTIFTGNSDANGQYDFSTILTTWYASYNPSDTTIAELVHHTVTGTSETEDATYKDHVATFSIAGYATKTYPITMDVTRKNDTVTMVKTPATIGSISVVDVSDSISVVDVSNSISVVSL